MVLILIDTVQFYICFVSVSGPDVLWIGILTIMYFGMLTGPTRIKFSFNAIVFFVLLHRASVHETVSS
jgi:hypothetical protein